MWLVAARCAAQIREGSVITESAVGQRCPQLLLWMQSQTALCCHPWRAESGRLTPWVLPSLFPEMTALYCCWRLEKPRSVNPENRSFIPNFSVWKGKCHTMSSELWFQSSFYILKRKQKTQWFLFSFLFFSFLVFKQWSRLKNNAVFSASSPLPSFWDQRRKTGEKNMKSPCSLWNTYVTLHGSNVHSRAVFKCSLLCECQDGRRKEASSLFSPLFSVLFSCKWKLAKPPAPSPLGTEVFCSAQTSSLHCGEGPHGTEPPSALCLGRFPLWRQHFMVARRALRKGLALQTGELGSEMWPPGVLQDHLPSLGDSSVGMWGLAAAATAAYDNNNINNTTIHHLFTCQLTSFS